ncbi:MAG: hypothetical protein VW257_01975 [Quisquiliibacterium sp.]
MSDSNPRPERTITVETAELGPVRVRRLSLGGMARIAERLRADGNDDEIALGDALVAEVIVAGMQNDPLPDDQGPDPFDNARLALLSEQDRRSIAAAVLTLEGVKAAGDDIFEDPRSALARRYSHVLDLQSQSGQPATARLLMADDPVRAEPPDRHPQIALFEGMAAPAAPPAGSTAETARAPSRASAWEKEKTALLADIADLQELVEIEREHNLDLQDQLASQAAPPQGRGWQDWLFRWLPRRRWLAVAVPAVVVLVLVAQYLWIASLRGDIATLRSAFQARAAAHQQALEQAQQLAAQANARADMLAGELAALRAKQQAAARATKPATKPTRRSPRTSSSKTTTSKPGSTR